MAATGDDVPTVSCGSVLLYFFHTCERSEHDARHTIAAVPSYLQFRFCSQRFQLPTVNCGPGAAAPPSDQSSEVRTSMVAERYVRATTSQRPRHNAMTPHFSYHVGNYHHSIIARRWVSTLQERCLEKEKDHIHILLFSILF